MSSDVLKDGLRAAFRHWLRAPAVSLIILIGFTAAALGMQVSFETARQLRQEVRRAVPRDVVDAIGYLRIGYTRMAAPAAPAAPRFDRALFQRLLELPGVAGVFHAVDNKGVLADGQEVRVRMLVVGGTYPFCSPQDRELLRRTLAAGQCGVNERLVEGLVEGLGTAPQVVQAFPDRVTAVGAVVDTALLKDPQPTLYYPVAALPDYGGASEIGLLARSPADLQGALDEAARCLEQAYPASDVALIKETEMDRVRERLRELDAIAAAFTVVSLALLVVALANLSNLYALSLLRQARGLAIRRAIGASRREIWLIVILDASGIAICGAAAGCGLASLAGAKWFGLAPVPAAWTVAATAAVIAASAALTVGPLARRLVAREPGLLLRERL